MSDPGERAGPLCGIKILDLTIWQSGPFSTVMLSDMGAEVIKVEDRTTGDPGRGFMDAGATSGVSGYFEAMNRNKRSITLDLKSDAGRELFYRLAAKVDVVIQNFRFGVAEKLKIAYADLLPHNPKIIYASATGYGPGDFDWPRQQGFTVIEAEKCWYNSMTPLMQEVCAKIGNQPCYLTYDIDSLDPAFAPGRAAEHR